MDREPLYLRTWPDRQTNTLTKQQTQALRAKSQQAEAEAEALDQLEHQVAEPKKSRAALERERKKRRSESAGPKWFDLPATEVTPELERNLKLLKMRDVLDPKRHYRANDSKQLPKYFQIGTVVDNPADFYAEGGAHVRRRKRVRDQRKE